MDQLGVVRRLQTTTGNSLSQPLAARSRGSIRRGLMPASTRPLARSAWPLDCGCAAEDRSSWMPLVAQNCWKAPLAKFEPLSVMMLWG